MKTVTVPLGKRTYNVLIEEGLLDKTGPHFRRVFGEKAAAAVITDDQVAPLYLKRVLDSLEGSGVRAVSIVLPHGEPTKCLASLERLYTFLSESGITRTDAIIALGGGVMGDLAGLAAATWLRGIRFLQIPTTLLAQVDSSVGGKVAVDLPQGKNLVGAFWQPSLVLCDPLTLETLSEDYWRDGLGEVVKYGAINDSALFDLLKDCAPGGRQALMTRIDEILLHCIQAKANVVAQDETDHGLRATLNFGHTVAHAIETVQHYGGLRHGEAVAAGMAVITRISEEKGLTAAGTLESLVCLEKALELPCALPDLKEEDLLQAMTHDKKNENGQLKLILLKDIGSCYVYPASADFFAGQLR